MKNLITLSIGLFLTLIMSTSIFAQEDESVTEDQGNNLLNTNANPVFNLMGISPTDFRRPTSLKDVTATLQTATNEFMQLPASYAVEFGMAQLFGTDNENTCNLRDDLGLTVGYNNEFVDPETGINSLLVGGGLSFGWRKDKHVPNPIDDKTEEKIDKLKEEVQEMKFMVLSGFQSHLSSDPKSAAESLDNYFAPLENRIKALEEENLGLIPKNLFFDFACGYVREFRKDSISDSRDNNMGAWVTTGFENHKDWLSFLAQAKVTHNPNFLLAMDNPIASTAFDWGFRVIVNSPNQKVDFSFEYVRRSREKLSDDAMIKYSFNLNATVGKDTKLNLTLGKNFGEDVTQDGNLISLVNLVKSFGK